MPYYVGVDIGASRAKLVVVDQGGQVVAQAIRHSGVDYQATAAQCRAEALGRAGLTDADVARSVATGYGRDNVPWAHSTMTEIACHGKGAFHHFRRAMTVIDIGAQDSKVIHLDASGRRTSFKMNRKCAAGTGAFLEEIAHRLDVPVADLNRLAECSTQNVTLGSFCTVFTATEILEKIRAGVKVEDLIKGAFRSVVKRIREMDMPQGALVLSGGVIAHNPILATLIREEFGQEPLVPPDPQFLGAFGAALFALESHAKETSAQGA